MTAQLQVVPQRPPLTPDQQFARDRDKIVEAAPYRLRAFSRPRYCVESLIAAMRFKIVRRFAQGALLTCGSAKL